MTTCFNSLEQLRKQYCKIGEKQREWWWCFDDSIGLIGNELALNYYVILEDFLPDSQANDINNEVRNLHGTDRFAQKGGIGGGNLGKDAKCLDPKIRSDLLGYFDGSESFLLHPTSLIALFDKINTLVCELRDSSNVSMSTELINVKTRSDAMITCYPGECTHYSKHVDNPIKNGRKLSCIYYTNKDWLTEYGGQLKLYPSVGGKDGIVVEPAFNRLVLFWSDHRCPHEVLPCNRMRYAVTVWFIDRLEKHLSTIAAAQALKSEVIETNPKLISAATVAQGKLDIASSDKSADTIKKVSPDDDEFKLVKVLSGDACAQLIHIPYTIAVSESNASILIVEVHLSSMDMSKGEVLSLDITHTNEDNLLKISIPTDLSSKYSHYCFPICIPLSTSVCSKSITAKYKDKLKKLIITLTNI